MLIVKSETLDPRFFFAAEEFLLKNYDEEVFMLWRTEPTLMIGRNQNTISEINVDYAKANNIIVVRRITGGGTVYTDLGNTNFTFISNEGNKSFANFEKFARPIIEVLHELGVDAEFSGRNDIVIDGKKVSGNAQYKFKNRLLHHGTLLFSSDLKDLSKALKPNKLKLESKGVSSVRSRVTNIATHLKETIDITEFRGLIYEHINKLYPNSTLYSFSNDDLNQIQVIMDNRYNNWNWNYGSSPKYTSSHAKKLTGGIIEVHFQVTAGKFKSVKIFGDFFSRRDVSDVEHALVGIKHNKESILDVLDKLDFDEYFTNIPKNEFIQLFFEETL